MQPAWQKRAAWLFAGQTGDPQAGQLYARWIFLRALGVLLFSAFYSLAFQIQGLIGPTGILLRKASSRRSLASSPASPASPMRRRSSGSAPDRTR